MIRPNTKAAYEFFHQATLALADMEQTGITVDVKYLDGAIAAEEAKIKAAEESLKAAPEWAAWKKRFGQATNFESETQLGVLLFEVMKLKSGGRTGKAAKWKTDVAVLEKVDSPWAQQYLKLKKMRKSLGTYLLGIRRETTAAGTLHCSYNLASGYEDAGGGATSFRGSCSDINFQNQPVRNPDMAGVIRPCYVAAAGCRLVEVDFSGIEVRIAACYNKDPVLVKYIKDKTTDMHRDMACEIFMLSPDQVSKKGTRDASKNMFVFPQFYGSVYFQCAPALWDAMLRRGFKIEGTDDLVIDHLKGKGVVKLGECDPVKIKESGTQAGTFVHHLKKVEHAFWHKRFKRYTKWKQEWYDAYLKTGEFHFHTGFTCTGVYKRNAVLNYAIQGSAFHCLLKTIMLVRAEVKRRKMKARFVGQIHDSMLADVPHAEVQDFLTIVHDAATRRLAQEWAWVTVPMEVEVDVVPEGQSWHQKQPWTCEGGVWRPV